MYKYRFITIVVLLLAPVSATIAMAEESPYVSLNVGSDWGTYSSSGTSSGGGFYNGTLSHTDMQDGWLSGVAAGYRLSDMVRVDASYTYLQNELSWQGNFGLLARPSAYKSEARSHVFLVNGYLHGKGLFQTGQFDPFIGAGAGLAYNELYGVNESFSAVPGGAVLRNGYSVNPAFRLGAGMDVPLTDTLNLTFALDAFWLGQFQTARQRSIDGFAYVPIGQWAVNNVVTTSASVGLRYAF